MTWSLRWTRFGPAASRGLRCQSCGQPFRCEVSLGGCWCKEISLSDAARARLRERFTECVCRDCLSRYGREADAERGAVSERSADE
jgi:hypothetical protein